ncbi:FAD-dependent monooxygenase [Amycolatopsis sp. H20-H5]|uniref:FAD-dependent monooxygenase n=1 Tax=Amycolatopsis sp. H20-H5 TaxID=3046309 RepID=UPI002DB69FF0|nr:FAD-dependent monooxygenase [Amycolatopsis sp. H20-H5]MEC3977075.1 FAD-dependent monooxygenase [Amycolatopsis sp. H20-H5]
MTSILISGGGIAGTAAAYWLHQHGFKTTVVERAPAPRAGGQAIDIRGTALTVVERMGLLPRVHGAATEMRGMSFVNARGRKLASVTEHTLTGGLTGGEDVEILRDDLNDILYDATSEDVEYVFGDWITGLDQHETGVRVTFAKGEPREFDLVVGSDGLHSGVRALTFGPESRFLHHLGTYVAVFTTENFLDLDHWQTFHMTPGRMSGLYSARDNTEARAILGFTSAPLDYDRHDLAQQRELIADVFAGHGWEASRLIEAMDSAPDFYFDSAAQIRLDRWSEGRVVATVGHGHEPGARRRVRPGR